MKHKLIVFKILASIIPAFIFFLPNSLFMGLNMLQQRALGIFILAILFWSFEIIPIYATSLLVIFLELFFMSDSAPKFLVGNIGDLKLLSYANLLRTLSDPIIVLFLGGFFLAAASEKYSLDKNLIKIIVKPFGNKSKYLMLGFMLVTSILSSFMSNTATTALMLGLIIPIFNMFDPKDRGRVGLTLSIPFAANIGGLGTPIGTPPNGIVLQLLAHEGHEVSFLKWTFVSFPFAMIMTVVLWVILVISFPFEKKEIKINIESSFRKDFKAIVLYITFIITFILWTFGEGIGINTNAVAFIPVVVFLAFGILEKEDVKKIDWTVLWLMAGGISLGQLLGFTGLDKLIVNAIPFAKMSPYIILLISGLISFIFANFISRTSSTALLAPIVYAIVSHLPMGGSAPSEKVFMIFLAFTTSFGMSLPISTPPNAMAYASGVVESKDMILSGFIIGVLGVAASYFYLLVIGKFGIL